MLQHIFSSQSMHLIRSFTWDLVNALPVPPAFRWIIVSAVAFFGWKVVKKAKKFLF